MSGEALWLLAAWGMLVTAFVHPSDTVGLMMGVGAYVCCLMSAYRRGAQ